MSGRPSAHEASTSLTDLQVSGLKSITAKHLALSCQCLSALITLHPVLSLVLMALVQQPRLGLLQPEFDRVLQVCVLPTLRVTTQLWMQCSLTAVHFALAALSTPLSSRGAGSSHAWGASRSVVTGSTCLVQTEQRLHCIAQKHTAAGSH